MWCSLWLERVVSAEPGSLSSREIRGFSRSPWLACGCEQLSEESRGQASSSQEGGEGKGGLLPPPHIQGCDVAAAAQPLITPSSSPALLVALSVLAEPGPSSRCAPLPAVSIPDLLIVAGLCIQSGGACT